MQTCSNCGAAARPGAKFCTSCGARLPILPASGDQGWGNGDQKPDDQTVATQQPTPENGQHSDEPVADNGQVAAVASAHDQTGQDAGPADQADNAAGHATDHASPGWSWGRTPTDEAAVVQSASTDEHSSGDDEPKETAAANSGWFASWSNPAADQTASTGQAETVAAVDQPAVDAAGHDASQHVADGASGDAQAAADVSSSEAEHPTWVAAMAAHDEPSSDSADLETVASGSAGQTSEHDDFFGANAEELAPTAPTSEANDQTEEEKEIEEIIASSLGDDLASDQSNAAPETVEDHTGATAEAVGVAGEVEDHAGAASEAAGVADEAGGAEEPAVPDAEADAELDSVGAVSAGEPAVAVMPAAEAPVPEPAGDGDPASEAEALLDRLRDLLPLLAAGGAAPADTGAIADRLQRAANENALAEFDDLRGVLEAAKQHPRDVDTMLSLVDKIDPMLDLLHAHGNLLDAIEGAVLQLRDTPRE